MASEWLTYAEFGERIGVTPEAARQRAMRLKLRRQVGNDGKARVAVDLEEISLNPPKTPVDRPSDTRTNDSPTGVEQGADAHLDLPSQTPEHPAEERLYEALREQIGFIQEQLAKAEALAEQRRLEAERERDRASELVADLRKLAERMAEAERASAEAGRARAEAEQARAELVAFRSRPWWRRAFG